MTEWVAMNTDSSPKKGFEPPYYLQQSFGRHSGWKMHGAGRAAWDVTVGTQQERAFYAMQCLMTRGQFIHACTFPEGTKC